MSQPDYLKSHLAERAAEERKIKEEPLYRIKPLVWEEENVFGTINSRPALGPLYAVAVGKIGWQWYNGREGWQPCASLDEGKKKAESHYRAFIATALEVVES